MVARSLSCFPLHGILTQLDWLIADLSISEEVVKLIFQSHKRFSDVSELLLSCLVVQLVHLMCSCLQMQDNIKSFTVSKTKALCAEVTCRVTTFNGSIL